MPRALSHVSLIALLAAMPLAGQALASSDPSACIPSSPADDDVVTCSGTGTGFTDDDLDGVTVTVAPGAQISGDGDRAFEVDDDLTLTNHGSITSAEDQAVKADKRATLTNNGTITSTAWYEEDDEMVGEDAVNVDDEALITNNGTITGTDEGVQVGDFSTVHNYGAITGTDRGVDTGARTTVINHEDGTITALDSDGLRIDGAEGVVTNYGEISGADEGIQTGADATIHNYGTITGEDHAIDTSGEDDGDPNATTIVNHEGALIEGIDGDGIHFEGTGGSITNRGTILAGDEGIQAEDEVTVRNYGLIDSADKGIAVEDDATVINEGTILSLTEGIEAEDNAVITNRGSIETLDDAINAGENATIFNYGDLLVTGPQDGIDIDSGAVTNYGSIVSEGGEDGIDFDASDVATSTITNHGLIEGKIGINVELGGDDPANTQSQVVVNHGTIIGHSGTALQLGAGDDTLDVYSMDIRGVVDLGEGTDTLIARSTVRSGAVRFVTDPEVIDLSEAPQATYANLTLAVADPEAFAGMDSVAAGQTLSLGKSVLLPLGEGAGSAGAFSFAEGTLGAPAWWVSGSAAVFDGDGSGRLTLGRDFDGVGLFLSYGRAATTVSDGHDLTSDAVLLGLTSAAALPGGATLAGMAYLGFGTLDLDSAATASGDGSADTRSFGLAGSVTTAPTAGGLAFTARAGIERQSIDAFRVSGLGGATFGDRDVTTGYVSAEARLTRALPDGTAITPFIGADVLFTDGEKVTMTLGDGTARFSTGADSSVAQLTLGVELAGADRPWALRIEGQYDENDKAGVLLTAGMRF
ncbi:autotransporter outer membrane beta-barrel domain-containing protein [Ferrimonas balearica]|nr:autotransporter outer membrane beta-barrel domain-containing protein [Ferrimonas balearica]